LEKQHTTNNTLEGWYRALQMENDDNIDMIEAIPSTTSLSPIPREEGEEVNSNRWESSDDTSSDISGYTKPPKKKRPLFYPFHLNIHLPSVHNRARWRYKLGAFIESHKVQLFIVALIILDLVITIVEMFLEETYKCKEHHEIPHAVEEAEDVFRIITLVLLGIFEVEIILLIIAFGIDFFKHPLYVLDGVIITTSIVIDVVFRDSASNLLIIFRLWRIVRVGHGIAVSVETHDREKYNHLKKHFKRVKIHYKQVEMENLELRKRLGIPLDEKLEFEMSLTSDSTKTNLSSQSPPTLSPSTYASSDSLPPFAQHSHSHSHSNNKNNNDDGNNNNEIMAMKEISKITNK